MYESQHNFMIIRFEDSFLGYFLSRQKAIKIYLCAMREAICALLSVITCVALMHLYIRMHSIFELQIPSMVNIFPFPFCAYIVRIC